MPASPSAQTMNGRTRSTSLVGLIALVLSVLPVFADAPAADAATEERWTEPGPGFVANETGAAGRDIYLVLHQAPPLSRYRGEVPGLAPTAPDITGADRLDPSSAASAAYLEYLSAQHDDLLADIEAALDRSVEVVYRYDAVLNGIAARITAGEAEVVASLPGVRHVERDSRLELHTDNGPRWIGADEVWGEDPVTGNADCEGNCGEGVVIGVIDTGVNHDHPSFADVGGDGYDHSNPRAIFFGACDPATGAPFCNDKLIGFWDFTGTTPEDDNGHGTHTASTSGGNVLNVVWEAPTYTLDRDIAGVAPHANIISYKGCSGTPIGCQLSALVASINQATLDAVDVINYSIGGSSSNPWSDLDSQAFFDAYSAGIFVATSAGNEGPGARTVGSPADAPWVTSVGASTHDRRLDNGIIDMAGGNTTPPADIFGKSLTAGYGPARVVYAGDYGSALCGEGAADPTTGESETNPFPPGTFNGEIVVCDRGTYGRVAKAENVAEGGAGGYVLANDADNGDSLVADPYPIPGVHITYDDGIVLKQWIADGGGADHTGTGSIQGTLLSITPGNGDIMASFSSRGPNPAVPGLVKPDVTAPGVDILAAWMSPLGSAGDPPEFNVISGTSMSSPHTAGAGALVRAVHPEWSPDEVKSALMTTAFTVTPGTGSEVHGVLKEDSATPADPFDMGAGRVDLRQAASAGLVLDETVSGYETANPGLGGDPTTLNLASLGNDFCATVCEWTRTVRGTASGAVTWTSSATTPAGMTVTVSPSSFTLSEGEAVTLTITADVGGVSAKDVWTFAEVQLTPSSTSVPPVHLPMAVIPTSSGPGMTLHLHGNLHDGCTGDGAADLTTGGCTPFLSDNAELDTEPAAHWGPIQTAFDCTGDRCVSDPNWIWQLDGSTTLQGPMTVGWWFAGPGVNTLLFDDFEIRLYADGTEVLREVVRHNVTVPNVPEFLQSTVDVPKVTALDNFVLVIDPIFVNQNDSFIYYDSAQPCPGVTADVSCDSTVRMPVIGDVDLPPDAQDDRAFVLNGGSVDIDVLGNDSDPEGGPLAVEIVTGPSNGTADLNLDNTVRYTHDGSTTTSDSFVYQITDNAGQTDTATVFVTISDECLVVAGDYHDDFESGAEGWSVDTAVLNDPASQSWLLVADPLATSPTHSWFTDALAQKPDGGIAKDVRLVSPPQLVSNLTHLTFWHRFDTEPAFDGGVLEVSADGGATWQDVEAAGGVFLANGYNSVIDPSNGDNPLQGRNAWSGPSSPPAGATEMLQVEVDLSVLAGETIQVRYRFGQDELVGHPGGWWIDDVTFTSLFEPCGEPPVAVDDSATVSNGGAVTVDVKANDSDPDDANADLTVSIETPPSSGSAVVNADGTITYTHDGSATTSDSFQYRLTDPDGAFDTATVTITVEGGGGVEVSQATAGGFLEPTSGKKINFNFDAANQEGSPSGELKLKDKTRDVDIHLTEVTSLGPVESECGSVPEAGNSAEFQGAGTFNDGDATFRVCVQDNGERGDGDLFYLECVTGCIYTSGELTEDDVIDGGNIHVESTSASPESEGSTTENTSTASVLMLDPLLLGEGVLGTAQVLLVTAYDANGDLVAEDVEITLTWTGSEGGSGSATALTDALGVAAFTIIVDDGDIEYLAWSGELSSNAIDITGLADPTEGP